MNLLTFLTTDMVKIHYKWGEISHAHILNSQSPVSGLQTDLFYCSDLFLWTSGYGTRMHLFYTVGCITDTRYWRVLLQENCAVNILFCLYCWQINVLNVLFMRPFIKIFDFELMRKEQRTEEKNRTKLTLFNSWKNSTSPGPDLVPKDAFWKAIFRELENISKWSLYKPASHRSSLNSGQSEVFHMTAAAGPGAKAL